MVFYVLLVYHALQVLSKCLKLCFKHYANKITNAYAFKHFSNCLQMWLEVHDPTSACPAVRLQQQKTLRFNITQTSKGWVKFEIQYYRMHKRIPL